MDQGKIRRGTQGMSVDCNPVVFVLLVFLGATCSSLWLKVPQIK